MNTGRRYSTKTEAVAEGERIADEQAATTGTDVEASAYKVPGLGWVLLPADTWNELHEDHDEVLADLPSVEANSLPVGECEATGFQPKGQPVTLTEVREALAAA